MERYCRIVVLCETVGAVVLREIFSTFYTNSSLEVYLAQSAQETTIRRLLTRRILRHEQYLLLYLGNGVTPDVETFDVSLLYLLIRNLGPNPTHAVWGVVPHAADTSLEADVERIRNHRNHFSHRTSFEVSDAEYSSVCTDLRNVFRRRIAAVTTPTVSVSELDKRVESVLNSALDPEKIIRIQEEWIRSHIRDRSKGDGRIELEAFVQNTKDYFVETQNWEKAQRVLEEKNCVVIKGNCGIGKTLLAMMLAVKHLETNSEVRVVICREPEEFSKLEVSGTCLVLFEDFCGKNSYSSDERSKWSRLGDKIKTFLTNGQLKIILTVKTQILKKVLQAIPCTDPIHDIVKEDCHVGLSNSSLTDEQMLNMLGKRTRKRKAESQTFLAALENARTQEIIGLPLLCQMAGQKDSDDDIEALFNTGLPSLLREQIDWLERQEPQIYMLLQVASRCDWRLERNGFTVREAEHFKEIAKNLGIEIPAASRKDRLCQEIVGSFLREEQGAFVVHDELVKSALRSGQSDNDTRPSRFWQILTWMGGVLLSILCAPYDLFVWLARIACGSS